MEKDKTVKIRLDMALVERGLLKSRSQALDYIKRGKVLVNGKLSQKQSQKVSIADSLELTQEDIYVGRGALKLVKAIEAFSLSCEGKACLDIGASTGGFTEVLIKNGASKVYAVDVGENQLETSLVENERVLNWEKTDILMIQEFDPEIKLAVMDVSFISVYKVLPHLFQKLAAEDYMVLFKPQFEVGREKVGKGGIVSLEEARSALSEFTQYLEGLDWKVKSLESPIKGKKGNTEYLVFFTKS